jgi:aspartyl-tRNA(Asn)/glutamyl-tRNA(Gln) amidotransferase subunit C
MTMSETPGISRSDVANLAKLARIEMTENELDHLASELAVILSAVARVSEIATSDIPPTSHPLPLVNVFRDDQRTPSLTADEALSGAPAQEDGRFKVPQILGEEA